MYLNPEYNRNLKAIKEPQDYDYRGNIFLTKSYDEFLESQNLKSNLDSLVKAAGYENLLKTFKVSKSDTAPEILKERSDIENLDQRLYKIGLGAFVDAKELAETEEIDFTDSELLQVYLDSKNTEITQTTSKEEDSEVSETGNE